MRVFRRRKWERRKFCDGYLLPKLCEDMHDAAGRGTYKERERMQMRS